MSNGDWRNENRIVAALTFAVLIVILVYAVWAMSALHTKESIEASQRTAQYAKDTKQQILEGCTVPELSALRDCVTEKVKTSEENQRATYDLVAQNVTARWTLGMFIVALTGTALSIVGIRYLALNLDEMRESRNLTSKAIEAAKEANELAFDAHRPWVSFSQLIMNRHNNITMGNVTYPESMTIGVEFVNRGNRPACGCAVNLTLKVVDISLEEAKLLQFPPYNFENRTDAAPGMTFNASAQNVHPCQYPDLISGKLSALVYVVVEYSKASGTIANCTTQLAFRIEFNGTRIDDKGTESPNWKAIPIGHSLMT